MQNRPAIGRIVLFLCIMSVPCTTQAEEFWARAHAVGKGQDLLYVIDATKAGPPSRRLYCETSLPRYVEEMATAAERINSSLLLRVRARVERGVGGERAADVKVLAVVVAAESTWPLFTQMKGWGTEREPLPEEPVSPPFKGAPEGDPFGSSGNE